MEHRALLLVFGPVLALTILGTISADAAALAAAAADQEPRFLGVTSLSTSRYGGHNQWHLNEARSTSQPFRFNASALSKVLIKIRSVVFVG